MWKTQPPKSPLSGGLSIQFPPDKGSLSLNSPLIRGQGGLGKTNIGFLHSLFSPVIPTKKAPPVIPAKETVQKALARHTLHVENPTP